MVNNCIVDNAKKVSITRAMAQRKTWLVRITETTKDGRTRRRIGRTTGYWATQARSAFAADDRYVGRALRAKPTDWSAPIRRVPPVKIGSC